MAQEILLYSPIFDFVAESFINQLNSIDGKDVTIRINSPGGSVYAGWGIVAKTLEHKGNLKLKVDGSADSMASVLLLFHNNVEALNVSGFTLHRASGGNRSAAGIAELKKINDDIRNAFESKINIAEFQEISGVTVDEFFNSEEVIDVKLTAEEAQRIGLINSVNTLVPAELQALNNRIAAFNSAHIDSNNEKEKYKNSKNKTMNKGELNKSNPELVTSLISEGRESGKLEGIKSEKDRIGSWMAFFDADPVAVKAGIESGEAISATAMSELTIKAVGMKAVAEVKEDSEEPTSTESPVAERTDEEIEAQKFEEELDSELK